MPHLASLPSTTPGSLVDVGPLTMRPGGCVANTGVALAALGTPVDRTLFFAGEAVTGENTVDGAYDSGYAVSGDLLSDL
jgi:hypothetical protein